MGAHSVAQVKAHLSAILEAVERGEEVVITKRGKAIARIRPEPPFTTGIDWATIDAFRESLRKGPASVARLRKQARY